VEGVFFFFCKLGPHLIKDVGEGLMVVIKVPRIERIHGAIVRSSEGGAFEAHPFCAGKVDGGKTGKDGDVPHGEHLFEGGGPITMLIGVLAAEPADEIPIAKV
jgi:hypothetical protein